MRICDVNSIGICDIITIIQVIIVPILFEIVIVAISITEIFKLVVALWLISISDQSMILALTVDCFKSINVESIHKSNGYKQDETQQVKNIESKTTHKIARSFDRHCSIYHRINILLMIYCWSHKHFHIEYHQNNLVLRDKSKMDDTK